jgi:hypothetical protein
MVLTVLKFLLSGQNVNLPIQNILSITKFWLNKHNCDSTTTEQTLYLLETILKQNYFQYNNQYYQLN